MILNAVEIGRLTGRSEPLNLLDRVLEKDSNALVALTNVTINEEFFQGHFPGNPVMPGVLIIEALAQGCEILLADSQSTLKLSQIKKARFREMVKPGDQLTIKVKRKLEDEFVFKTEAYIQNKLACSAELAFS
ncbi:3-hydroxyacyl-ACP dehydratase FabZ [Lactobacillus helveticus]|uniref:3-hydroxyacyl-ACP dehydratase FabZ n=1 Tax=Lactobacillus helveticus TaxID=1587 RepID=UPI000D7BEAE3|nr:3-hydroxyacyl-ACP dehydratase FabZ [Lactobacillus helveticus]NRO50502.1 3-hydroxyacyl-[acyl-carrier-protein] dehydratase FabZ [Lactobacillus helveticus]NRO67834.1 3-hydroxyacyl-[acyl-carrier-protein] dehydratase FabZ [Lactobacillus helveticus]NRO69727.1 3-hydroxyacyl-[acyl-carrier-protein] dehydratase FabZ [Lactobacillus helveticus]PXZ21767.1 3-hydroxyacyl-[acyl-carrier-protein] dehydratase FabZ [Lactobacillus helveticus]TLQ23769.1 3-hydroxyacyl-ACP dehydratase FabZ [Lactobacillus helveticu